MTIKDLTTNTATVLFDDDQARKAFTLANLIFNPPAMEALNKTAVSLSNSGLVPDHLKGKPDDMMAIIMQAGRWGMDVIAVAQASFVLNGKIGYEAKLQQAVAKANGGIDFIEEYYGNWSKIQGNFVVKTANNTKGSKYNAPNWTPHDEIGVGVKLTGTFPDGRTRTIDVQLNTCFPRNSTNWANDPQQQIYYTAVKRWVRRYAPHLGLGIQDYDDLAASQNQRTERVINPVSDKPAAARQVESVDDILNAPNKTAPAPEKPAPAVESVDDILSTGEQPPAQDTPPSIYEQLTDMLNEVQAKEDYPQVKKACIEAFNNGSLADNEAETLGKLLRTLESSFNPENSK